MLTIFKYYPLFFSGILSSVLFVTGHSCGPPKHVHLAVGKDASTQMMVSFASAPCTDRDPDVPEVAVLIGPHEDQLDRVVRPTHPAKRYETTIPIHKRKVHIPYYSDYFHHVAIDNLEPNTTYYYQCVVLVGDFEAEEMTQRGFEDSDAGRYLNEMRTRSHVYSFKTAPPPGPDSSLNLVYMGDLSQTDRSADTMKKLRRNKHDYDAIMLAGDIAYPQDDQNKWDSWFDLMDGFRVYQFLPLMVAPGNHDIDHFEHFDSKIYVSYEKRFMMPQIRGPQMKPYLGGELTMHDVAYPLDYEYGNAYYSYIYGPTHNVVISSYSNFDPGSKQYDWITKELASVDRTVTPWLIVTLHCPIYNTFERHHKDIQLLKAREHLEPLFVKSRVNFVFSGHVHAYMRTKTIIDGQVDKRGPMHVVVGDGGREIDAPFINEEPEEWLASRDATYYGYGTLNIPNRTHAQWNWVHTHDFDETDRTYNEVWKHDDEKLPPVERDTAWVENQYYL